MNFFFIMNFSFPQRGDTILSVNRRKVQNLKAFYQNIRVAHPTARIEVKRPLTKEETPVEIKDNLPPDLRDAIERRPGYHYEVRDNFYECYAFSCYNSFFPIQMVQIYRVRGLRFGLAIKTRDNRVIVTEVKPDSMCDNILKVYDQIVCIDGNRVSQGEVAQILLTTALKTVSTMICLFILFFCSFFFFSN